MKSEFLHTTCWPVYRFKGDLYVADLWRKDLELYLGHLQSMTLASPIVDGPPPSTATVVRKDVASRIRLVHVPSIVKGWRRWANTPEFVVRILWAMRKAQVFHTILVEHPILFGILFPLLRRFTSTRLVTFVESSSWRRPGATGWRRLYADLGERFARRAVKACHVSLHTQGEYRDSLGGNPGSSFVVPAVWLDESDIVSPDRLEQLFLSRSPAGSLRLGYFGGIVHDKGLDILIRAVLQCLDKGLDVGLDIYGEGPKREEYAALAKPREDRIRFLGMLRYGPEFFGKLSECDAISIPSRTNEHLRISVDAQSQGVPPVASDVPGLSHLIRDGENGLLVPKEDPAALAAAIERLLGDVELRQKLSRGAIAKVGGMSHRKMHEAYASHLVAVLGDLEALAPPGR